MVAVEILHPRWLSKSCDHGTSRERSEHGTLGTSTTACSECSELKGQLGDVTRRLEAQKVQMDTLCELMEGLRSSMQIPPPAPLPSPSSASPVVPSSNNPPLPSQVQSLGLTLVPSTESSPSQPPASPQQDVSTTQPEMDIIPADVLAILWCPPAVDSTHPPWSTSAPGDNYSPPSCLHLQ